MTKISKNKTKLMNLILPNKKVNLFIISIIILGIISGSIFLMLTSTADKNAVMEQIKTFMTNTNNNSIDIGLALKNSLIINYVFIILRWTLGLSIIGVLVNIFLTFIKGFLVGFSISSLFLTYSYKGLFIAIIYTFPIHIINIFVVSLLSIYSIMFSKNLLEIITSKKNNNRLMLKKYIVILAISVILSFISSLLEVYIFPNILRLVSIYYI